MNWLDLLLLGAFLLHVGSGFFKGFLKQFFDLFGFLGVTLLAFWGGRRFSAELAEYIDPEGLVTHHAVIEGLGLEMALERAPQFVAGLLLFLVLFLVLGLVMRLAMQGFQWINDLPVVGLLNRSGGAVLGTLTGVFFIYITVVVCSLLPLPFFMDAVEDSQVVFFTNHYLSPVAYYFRALILNFFLEMNG